MNKIELIVTYDDEYNVNVKISAEGIFNKFAMNSCESAMKKINEEFDKEVENQKSDTTRSEIANLLKGLLEKAGK